MVRYSKEYGDIFNNVFTWSLEVALKYLFKLSDNYVCKINSGRSFHDEMDRVSDGRLTRRQTSNMFYQLKLKGYISADPNNENAIVLTDKAKIKIVEEVISQSKAGHKNRYISFDIPERLHHRRDQFRHTIKRMGFRQIQQSLWVSNKNVGELVEIAAREYEVEDYVAYIVGEKSNIDSHIEKVLKE